MSIHNEVRQILVNELGLTRESVREQACGFVGETLDRYLGSVAFEQTLNKLVAERVTRALERYRNQDRLETLINEQVRLALEKQAADFVAQHVSFKAQRSEELFDQDDCAMLLHCLTHVLAEGSALLSSHDTERIHILRGRIREMGNALKEQDEKNGNGTN